MSMLNRSTFFVADMVIPFGWYGLFVWLMWLWPIWFVADMVQTRGTCLRPWHIFALLCSAWRPYENRTEQVLFANCPQKLAALNIAFNLIYILTRREKDRNNQTTSCEVVPVFTASAYGSSKDCKHRPQTHQRLVLHNLTQVMTYCCPVKMHVDWS